LKSKKYLKLKYQTKPEAGMYVELYKLINGEHTHKSFNVAKLVLYAFTKYDGSTIIYNDRNPKNPILNNLKWFKQFGIDTQFIYYQTIDDTYKGIYSTNPNEIITLSQLPKKHVIFSYPNNTETKKQK
jgi:hypothetical protein